MTYIIAEPCVDVKDGACVDVCPVDCIYGLDEEEDRQLFIHPEECIDCAACEPVCPGDRDLRRGRHAPGVGQLHRHQLRVLRDVPLGLSLPHRLSSTLPSVPRLVGMDKAGYSLEEPS